MRWPLLLLALLAAMAAAASVAVVMDTMDTVDVMGEPSTALGTVHPQFPTLLQGDPGAAGHERTLPAVWVCGVLMLAFAAALMAWSFRRHERSGWPAWALSGLLQQRLVRVRPGQVMAQRCQLHPVGGHSMVRRQLKGGLPGAGQVSLKPLR